MNHPSSEKRMTELWHQISKNLQNTTNLSYWLLEKDGRLHIRKGTGYFREHLEKGESYKLNEGLTGWVFQGNDFVGTREDVEQHQKTEYLTKYYVTSDTLRQADYYLMLPIPSLFPYDHPIGVFKAEAWKGDRGPFTKEEKDIVKGILYQHRESFGKLATAPFAFISYVSRDSKYFARDLAQDLRKNGIITWIAEEDNLPTIRETLTTAINLATHILLVISKGSKDSKWQQIEIARADSRREEMMHPPTVISLRTDDIEIDDANIVLSDFLRIDFIRDRDYRPGLQKLLRSFGKSITSLLTHVPDPKEYFVGRTLKIDECIVALAGGKHRLVTIAGQAGVGKSTMVAKVVYLLYEESLHQDTPPFESIIYLDVSIVTDEEDFASKIANGFGCSLEVKPGSSFDHLRETLLSKLPHSRRFLLIFDGFEWLVEKKKCMDLLYSLIELHPEGPQVLMTSRIVLKDVDKRFIVSEYLIRLKGLEQHEALTFFKRCYGEDDLDVDFERSLLSLMKKLEFLPIMIKILSQFNRDEIMKSGIQEMNPLNKDIYHLFYESYKHLTLDERRVFVSLCLFGDSFSETAVQGTSGLYHTKTILKTLRSWHLIDELDFGRYRLLDLVREFSMSLLEDSEALAVLNITKSQLKKNHAQYYLSFVEQRSRDYATLDEEYGNISNTLALLGDSIVGDRSAVDFLIQFCFALAPYWERRGKWRDSRKYTADCLRAMHQIEANMIHARLLLIHCWSSADLGIYFTETYNQFIEALTITDSLRQKTPQDREILRLHAKILQQLGRLIDNCIFELESAVPIHARRYGVFTRPEHYFNESCRIYQDLGDKKAVGGLLRNLGFRSMVCDDLFEAASFLTESADIAFEFDDPKFGRCLHQMGNVMLKLSEFQEFYDEHSVLAIKERIKPFLSEDVQSLPAALDWAICLFEKALEIGKDSMEERAKSRTLLQLSVALDRKKSRIMDESEKLATRQRALECAEEALRIATTIGEEKGREKIEQAIKRMKQEKDEKVSPMELKRPILSRSGSLHEAMANTSIKTIFLDVRGTVLSAFEDIEMISDLRRALGECAERGIHLVIASATSLKSTGMGFVIEPLLREFGERKIGKDYITNCFAYVESGTVAYRFNPELKIEPLESYEILKFRPNEEEMVVKTVHAICAVHGRNNVRTKPKPGQVNCYAGGPWIERRKIADHLNAKFYEHFGELNRLIAQVPSARETIDVALCTKSRIARDYVKRVGMADSEIIIIGDSLQSGGNDEPLSESLPNAISVQVGEIIPEKAVFHAKQRGPEGVLDTINCLLEIQHSRANR